MAAACPGRRAHPVRRFGPRAFALAVLAPGIAFAAFAGPVPPAPDFPRDDTVETVHGVEVADPYRRLEDGKDPVVQSWSEELNSRTLTYLDGLPSRAAVAARLAGMMTNASPYTHQLKARGPHLFGLRSDPSKQQPLLVVMPAAGDLGQARALVDPNRLDPGGGTSILWYAPSPDGRIVAVSLSKGGSEEGMLQLYDTASGRPIGETIDRVHQPTGLGALAWAADSGGFWYTRYPGEEAPKAERRFNVAL